MIPQTPFNTLAISLSGGGYRATAFHLGTLAYLSTRSWQNETLLNRIKVLSTVSGGTFTGVKYAATLKRGGSIEDCYKDLYQFMVKVDVIDETLKYLTDNSNWKLTRQRNLINSIASIYYRKFENAKFDLFWDQSPSIHLKEMSFNATEFNYGLPFRFQKTEIAPDGVGGQSPGYVGNFKIRIPPAAAREIRLADITAASSCFPLGFEPINYPHDFLHQSSGPLKDESLRYKKEEKEKEGLPPVGLMDGGVDDNQGIDAVIWAEERMRKAKQLKTGTTQDNAIDLFIVSDVSSPYMDCFIASTENKIPVIGNWSFNTFRLFTVLSALIAAACFCVAQFTSCKPWLIAMSVLGTLAILVAVTCFLISQSMKILTNKLKVPFYFANKLTTFNGLKFGVFLNLLINRGRSASSLVSDVFMKQVRRLSYGRIYADKAWQMRLIMNAVYELSPDEVKTQKSKRAILDPLLQDPGQAIMNVAQKARDMGTTLWFSPQELQGTDNMPATLIACGQFTICFNLMEYIEKLLQDPSVIAGTCYSASTQQELKVLYSELMSDWNKFQADPYWMVKQWAYKIAALINRALIIMSK